MKIYTHPQYYWLIRSTCEFWSRDVRTTRPSAPQAGLSFAKVLRPICSNHLILLQVSVGLLRHPNFFACLSPIKIYFGATPAAQFPNVQLKRPTALHQLQLQESFPLPVSAAFLLPPCCLLICTLCSSWPVLHTSTPDGHWMCHLFHSQIDSFAKNVIFITFRGDTLPCLV